MNSLNIISARVSPPASTTPSRSNSLSSLGLAVTSPGEGGRKDGGGTSLDEKDAFSTNPDEFQAPAQEDNTGASAGETSPLLAHGETKPTDVRSSAWHVLPRRIATTLLASIRWVLSTLAAPGVYLIACLYDENGNFTPLLPLRRQFGIYHGNTRKLATDYHEAASTGDKSGQTMFGNHTSSLSGQPGVGTDSSSPGLSSESDSDQDRQAGSSNRHGRSKSLQEGDEIAPGRRSIRIKLHSGDSLRQRKHRKAQSASARNGGGNADPKDISAQLKSPTSPAGALTKYPKTPAPPRPLIPRRQPSYINVESTDRTHQKTLILDLDETLIHSMSKGGRMSTGHMVEVRLNTAYMGVAGQASLGPQHPILYYVHKRPHCDDFLRRVRKEGNILLDHLIAGC